MSIELSEHTIGIWYISMNEKDWLASVHRDDEGKLHLIYRFRYYKDDKNFDSEDEKSWYEATSDPGADEAPLIDAVHKMCAILSSMEDGEVTTLMRDDKTYDQFFREFRALPFVHCSEVITDD